MRRRYSRGQKREQIVAALQEIHREVIEENRHSKQETGSIQYGFIYAEMDERAKRKLPDIKPPLTSTQIQHYLFYKKDRKRSIGSKKETM